MTKEKYSLGISPFDIAIGHVFAERPLPVTQSDTYIKLPDETGYTTPPKGSILVGMRFNEAGEILDAMAYDRASEVMWLYSPPPLDLWRPGPPLPEWDRNRGNVVGMEVSTMWYARLKYDNKEPADA